MANNKGNGPSAASTWTVVIGLIIFVGGLYYALQQHEVKMAEAERLHKEQEAREAAEKAKDPNEEIARKNPRFALESAVKLFSGVEGKVDERQARGLVLASANQDFALARAWAAGWRARGYCCFDRNQEKAVQALGGARPEVEKMAAEGDELAMVAMGWLLESGLGGPADPERAAQMFRRAADEKGNSTALVELARLKRSGYGSVEPNVLEAFKLLEEAAAKYDIRASLALGRMYRDGVGTEQSLGEAASRFRQAAELGSPEGQNLMALAHFDGAGVRRDFKVGLRLARQAVDQEYVPARATMGWAYLLSWGVPVDPEAAVMWFKQAADRGDVDAMRDLGALLVSGDKGVKRNREEGVRWLQRAADAGDMQAKDLLISATTVPDEPGAAPESAPPAGGIENEEPVEPGETKPAVQ